MTALTRLPDDAWASERPDGMLDYEARTIIRDLIRVDGFEKAREKIAFYLMDEADRRTS